MADLQVETEAICNDWKSTYWETLSRTTSSEAGHEWKFWQGIVQDWNSG
jgi:hypothetical protein